MSLYTWQDSIPSLARGSTTADLKLAVPGAANANTVRDLIRNGKIRRLLVQEWLNPLTGRVADRDPNKRQLLELLPGTAGAETLIDPLTTEAFVRVRWRKEDALGLNFCFTVQCSFGKVEDVSLFHGNLIDVYHGEVRNELFEKPSKAMSPGALPIERDGELGAVLRLPPGLLEYRETEPGGDVPPRSTLEVEVQTTSGVATWAEKADLIHSDDQATHFVVETDELGTSLIRFGDGHNGRRLENDAVVRVRYQAGFGPDGNVGQDSITTIVSGPAPLLTNATCWNPFDVRNGREPEAVEKIIRRAPERFRFRQLRAVTLQDYVKRAEELPDVSRATAAYGWTGSWRTVRIAIDPKAGVTLDDALRRKLARHLDAVRLIGEDLEIRPPVFVPLEIHVVLCVAPDFWPGDLRFIIEQEFSTGFTPDGRMGFFNPDAWTFGQAIYVSEILGAFKRYPVWNMF